MSRYITVLFVAVFFLAVSCSDDNAGVDNNPGQVKGLRFSHKSGLYPSSFSLTLASEKGTEIYYSIDGSVPDPKKVDGKRIFKYSSPIKVIDRNGEPNVLSARANTEKFYLAPDDPRGSLPTPYYPSDAQVPKATVIRAAAIYSNGSKSEEAILTYFIGSNLAKYSNNPVMSLVTEPRNLVDTQYGIYVRGPSDRRWNSNPSYNFCMRGEDWERIAFMELLIGDTKSRSVHLSSNVGIRIRGGWSRDRGQKSFNVYFRSEHGGINNLKNYKLIPGAVKSNGQPVDTYKSFMLRNGGNDTEQTKLYDVLIQNLLKDRNFATQASVPCVTYINGEYWGFYNLQERYSDNHTEYKYGVSRNNVISYDNGSLDDGTPADEALYWDMMGFSSINMDDAAYAEFCKVFDIKSFLDYWAAGIYINNQDWPHNNFRLWRTRNLEPGNPYGDNKWRYQLFDTEFSMGIYDGGAVRDPFNAILNGDSKNHPNNQLFANLMKNANFRQQLKAAIMELYNVNFHPDKFGPELDRLAGIYRPLMVDYNERFNNWRTFDNNVNNARKYLNDIRSKMLNEYLPKYLGS